jgi:serine/threonine protein kinase/tetratricopeptide (TPR) repeat protein
MSPLTTGDAARLGASDLLGSYRIDKQIGSGGMGEIYLAHDTRPNLDRDVAIKVLRHVTQARPRSRERFQQESRILAQLNHPNICTLYETGEQDDFVYIVMEFLRGETLSMRLARGPLPLPELLRYAKEIAEAVAYLHGESVVHRDLKPSNVMITDNGAKLLDFGIAKVFSGTDLSTVTNDMTGPHIVGTLRYMAPEVLSGEEADARSDIFALGAIIYEMATGRAAFDAATPAATISSILHSQPIDVRQLRPECPIPIEQIVSYCLAKDPKDRWQSAADLLKPLAWAKDHQNTPISDSNLPRREPRPRRKYVAAASAATLSVAMIGGVYSINTHRFVASPHLTAVPCEAPAELSDAAMLCSGLSEDFTRRLSRLTLTRPIQTTTLGESVRRGARTADVTRASIGATHVLAGRVEKNRDQVEIHYTLSETKPGSLRSDEVFALPVSEVFTSQDRLAAFVTRRIGLQLDHVERNALTAQPTASAAAFEAYLRGLGILRTAGRDAAATDRMVASLSEASTTDPSFAIAQAMSGFTSWAKFEQTHEASWRDASIAACDRATAADPRLPEGHACRGQWLHFQGRHKDAAAEFQSAVGLDRSYDDAIVWLGREFEDQRDFAGAEAVYRQAVSNRPAYWASHAWLGNYMRRQGRYDDAAAEFELVVQRIPDAGRTLGVLGLTLTYVGRYGDAVRAYERSVAIEPTVETYVNWGLTLVRMRAFEQAAAKLVEARKLGGDSSQVLGTAGRIAFYRRQKEAAELLAQAITAGQAELKSPARKQDLNLALADYCAKIGRQDEARKYLSDAGIDPAATARPSDPHLLFFGALVLNQLGDRRAALEWLDRAVYWGVPPSELIAFPELDGLRDEPAFKNLLTRK